MLMSLGDWFMPLGSMVAAAMAHNHNICVGHVMRVWLLVLGGAVPNPLSRWGAKMNKNVSFKITPTTDTIR
jgi:hypothetical protein